MIKLIKHSVFLGLISVMWSCNPAQNDTSLSSSSSTYLEDGFKNPPTSARPKGYWTFANGNFDLFQMTKEMESFKEKGVGTLDLWDVAGWQDPEGNTPAGPVFMSDESVQAFAHAIREAGRIGMDLGLTISSSWNAGGSWVKPEDGVMGLFESSITAKGPSKLNKEISFPEIPKQVDGWVNMILNNGDDGLPTFYKEVAVLANKVSKDSVITQSLDISKHFVDGKLAWDVPEGNWEITRYVCTGTGQPLIRPSPNSNGLMIDHFNPESMKMHLNYFFDKLEAEVGDLSKTSLKYLYTDSYEANSAVWTIKLPEEFKKRNGYDITQYLPALNGYTVINKDVTDRFLFDFKKTLSDMIIENHYALGKKMCNDKGLEFIAEAGGPGPPIHNVPFESLKALGACSAPRGEFWFEPTWSQEQKDGLQIVKGPASAAHIYNRPRVEAEAFTGVSLWQYGPGDYKTTADRAMCEGLTSFVYHTSPHIPREAGKPGWVYNFGTLMNTTRTWWDLSDGFHNYLGRSCFMLQQGNFVGDVLFYYGDKAPNFVKNKAYNESLGFGYDYDYTNSDIILNRLDVKNGRFVLPHGQSYSVIVLPNEEEINPEVLAKLKSLVKKGGILVGDKPLRSYSLHNFEANNAKVEKLANEMWKDGSDKIAYGKGTIYSKSKTLKSVLADLNIQPDVQVNKENPQNYIDYIHRVTKDADIYFVRNTSGVKQTLELKLRSDKASVEIWNPDNASTTKLPFYKVENGITALPISLDALESKFVVIRDGVLENNIVKVTKDGKVLFPDTKTDFPLVANNDDIVFETKGNYEFTYSDGSVKTFDNSNTNNEKLVTGKWQLRFPFGWGTPQRMDIDELKSWTDFKEEGVKYFSGQATYLKKIELTEAEVNSDNKVILDLGKVSKVAKVYINGHELAPIWFAPYTVDITEFAKKGDNYFRIEVANMFNNQLVGDGLRKGKEKRTHSNVVQGPNPWGDRWENLELLESGLMGPVKVKFEKVFK